MSLQLPNKLRPGECVAVPVDVNQHQSYPPTVTCAPIDAASVTDDRATICRGVTEDGKDKYSIHFKSELGGPFGAGVSREYISWNRGTAGFWAPFKPFGLALAKLVHPEAYSRYIFEVTPDSIALGRRKSAATTSSEIYGVDDLDRAALAVASTLACWGYHAEDAELLQFANTLFSTKLATPGLPLPTRDRIDRQKGDDLPLRDYAALAVQPDYSSVPVVGVATDAKAAMFIVPNISPAATAAVDVKANDLFPANLNFAPLNANVVTNDLAMLWSGDNTLCARFRSEAGGPLGGLDVARRLSTVAEAKALAASTEQFSPYALCINLGRQIFARRLSDGSQHKVDLPDRAVLFLAGALAAVAYSKRDFNLKHVADGMYAARGTMTTVGGDLPSQDRLQIQTRSALKGYANSHVEAVSDMVNDYCRKSSSDHNIFKCIGTGMDMPL